MTDQRICFKRLRLRRRLFFVINLCFITIYSHFKQECYTILIYYLFINLEMLRIIERDF